MTKPSAFEQNLQQDLINLEETTGAPEVFRLAQARRRAMAQQKPSPSKILWPALGASVASLVLVGVMLSEPMAFDNQQEASLKNQPDTEASDESLLEISDDHLYLYEDLDFYYWLADTDMGSAS